MLNFLKTGFRGIDLLSEYSTRQPLSRIALHFLRLPVNFRILHRVLFAGSLEVFLLFWHWSCRREPRGGFSFFRPWDWFWGIFLTDFAPNYAAVLDFSVDLRASDRLRCMLYGVVSGIFEVSPAGWIRRVLSMDFMSNRAEILAFTGIFAYHLGRFSSPCPESPAVTAFYWIDGAFCQFF